MRRDKDETIKSLIVARLGQQGIEHKIVKAFQSTEHPCSSYGVPVWVEARTHEPINDHEIIRVLK